MKLARKSVGENEETLALGAGEKKRSGRSMQEKFPFREMTFIEKRILQAKEKKKQEQGEVGGTVEENEETLDLGAGEKKRSGRSIQEKFPSREMTFIEKRILQANEEKKLGGRRGRVLERLFQCCQSFMKFLSEMKS
ncbi:hypothetical protein CDAR_418671 [Caerostris darwini]|uniref:Uncharacterized protein n=1 Tax=Caerostris darwini TaxID=1538125 RepID=A0AAV4MX28_9ARAC|nr:hypothetical protein CDAR_418671 [Caerostris darwini]